MKMHDAMIVWNDDKDDVFVVAHPPKTDADRRMNQICVLSWGACESHWRASPEDQALKLFILFNTLVVRDNLDPLAVHQAFLTIDEYRLLISPDIEGADAEGTYTSPSPWRIVFDGGL